MPTYLHERPDGTPVEYRAVATPDHLRVEGRVLRPDGTEHDARWWPAGAADCVALERAGSDIWARLERDVARRFAA